ncbi:MAG: hypothetical protein WC375_00160 [Methanomassiliicoccales archaeon]|jgi:hypothetical protein
MINGIKKLLLRCSKEPLRRAYKNNKLEQVVPPLDLLKSIHEIPKTDEEFEELSKTLTWVSYGVTGNELAKKSYLYQLETDHIVCILTFCNTLPLLRSVLLYVLKKKFSERLGEISSGTIAPVQTTNLLEADLKEALARLMVVVAAMNFPLDVEMKTWAGKILEDKVTANKDRTFSQVFKSVIEREKHS